MVMNILGIAAAVCAQQTQLSRLTCADSLLQTQQGEAIVFAAYHNIKKAFDILGGDLV